MVVGGEDSSLLVGDVIPGSDGIVYAVGTATSTFVYPKETIAAWNTFIRGQTGASSSKAAPPAGPVAPATDANTNGASAFRLGTTPRSAILAGLISWACVWLL